MKKIIAVTLCVLVCLLSVSCGKSKPPVVISPSDTQIVILASNDVIPITTTTTLTDYMSALKQKGKLSFDGTNGMYYFNGKQNSTSAVKGYFWCLYTSDEQNSSTMFGTCVYDGNTYGSASYGADSLIVKDGYLYIWSYDEYDYSI